MEDEVKLDELIAGPEAKPANGGPRRYPTPSTSPAVHRRSSPVDDEHLHLSILP
uniref:Uncharacterized protein n=1 Tax=Oryza barthii TaxID=65489 RepID=A0A0D3FSJ2_9ORYZ